MKYPSHTVRLVSQALLLFGFTFTALNAQAEPFNFKYIDKQKWHQLETEHYSIFANLRPKGLEDAGRQLEKYRAFSRLFLVTDPSGAARGAKTRLFLTNSDKTWKSLGLPKTTVSVYQTIPGVGAIIFARTNGFFGSQGLKRPNEGRAILLSAIASEMLASEGLTKTLPSWFITGFSFYLATYSEPKEGIMLGDPTAHRNRIYGLTNRLGHMGGLDTAELFRPAFKPNNDPSGSTSRRKKIKNSNSFYMRSFVAVHYFYADKDRRAQMFDYLAKIETGEDYTNAFEEVFEYGFEELDKRLFKYITSRHMLARVYAYEAIEPLLDVPEQSKLNPISSKEFFKKLLPTFSIMSDTLFAPEDKKALLVKIKEKYGKLFEQPSL
jgi:hypothetical protein